MRRMSGLLLAAALMGYGVASLAPQTPISAQEKPAAAETKKAGGRLPPYYGQIGLSTEQREKIYGVQSTYASQIEALQKQIASLEEKRDGEINAVLTADQKKQLDSLRAAAKEKTSRRKSDAAPKTEK